jgi:hypothetical protein
MRSCACTRSDTAGPLRTTSCRAWSNAACAEAGVHRLAATTRSCARRGGYPSIIGPCTAAIGALKRTCTIGRGSRCRNAEIGTRILEGKVFKMIREIMLDPGKLRGCIDTGGRLDDQSIARELARIAGEIGALDEERRRLIGRYAAELMAGAEYITANHALDSHPRDGRSQCLREVVNMQRRSQRCDELGLRSCHWTNGR